MKVKIRHVQRQDLSAIHGILVSPHVIQGTMRLPYHSLEYVEKRIEPSDGTIKLVACVENEVIGYGELATHSDAPRHRHVADINILAVNSNWLGKGIGGAILRSMLDLADNWMQVTRMSLIVWSSNENAISLYKKHGFELEGTLRQFVFKEGRYEDALLMARIKP
ncbi:MAG TPA: GNAT family N-acetyltransferase [Anaerolineales bacterium]|nr:GNAT family N-acetyltransferase [Anaerolineales bacterium]